MFFCSLNSAPLEGSDRVNNFAPSQTMCWMSSVTQHPASLMDTQITCLLQPKSEESAWLGQKEGAKCCAHSHVNYWVPSFKAVSSGTGFNKGGLANTGRIHKIADLESGARSMTVSGNSLRRNLWKIPFEDNRTWQLLALVVKSVGRKAWPAMSDPCQAVCG